MSPKRVPSQGVLRRVLGFRPKPADAFGTGAGHPAETGAKKFVLLFAFQTEAQDFFIKLAKFFGVFHPLGLSFSQNGTLSPGNTDAMQAGNSIPTDVPLRVE